MPHQKKTKSKRKQIEITNNIVSDGTKLIDTKEKTEVKYAS